MQGKGKGKGLHRAQNARGVMIDLNRAIVFPNRLREQRRRCGFPKLLRLASMIPEIPYIRLSKIERGEVIARADELRRVAKALAISPIDLLIDIDAPDFDLDTWSEPFRDAAAPDLNEARFAVLLAAAVRARRMGDPALTIAAIERIHHLPPVNLSRVENAQKPFARWNPTIQAGLFGLFGVDNEIALRELVENQYASGILDNLVEQVTDSEARHTRSSARIAELRAQLLQNGADMPPASAGFSAAAPSSAARRMLAVQGAPLPQGLIAETLGTETVEAPANAGPRAFALKVCRATLGAGLPGQALVIVDPDRQPIPGGIAALREEGGWRLLSVGADRAGRIIGYSVNPELEVAIDDYDPARLAAVVAALFV